MLPFSVRLFFASDDRSRSILRNDSVLLGSGSKFFSSWFFLKIVLLFDYRGENDRILTRNKIQLFSFNFFDEICYFFTIKLQHSDQFVLFLIEISQKVECYPKSKVRTNSNMILPQPSSLPQPMPAVCID